MAGLNTLNIHREESGNTVTLRLEGTFDAKTASEVRKLIENLEGADRREVVLDFSKIQKFVDSAVAVLTGGMDCTGVRLRGVDRHREAMFRYFGIAETRSSSKAYYTPEDVFFV